MEDGKQGVTFMQFCALIANFTKTSSRMLETIYQSVLFFHKIDAGDIVARKEKGQELIQQIRELRDSTATVLIVLKNNFTNIYSLPPSQQLVLNFCTSLIRIIIAFSNSAKKMESSEEIGRLYKDVLSSAKQTVSSINFSLKGSFVSEEQINTLVKNVKDVKLAATELEGKVRTRDKTNYFTAARAFVNNVNDLMATSSEMGILDVSLEAKLKASVVGIMSAGKTALGSTWDSVTAIVSMHEGKEELYLILKDLLTKCSLSRKAAALEMEKAGDIHMSLPSRTLSPIARTATNMKKSISASVPGSPNNSDLDIPSFRAKRALAGQPPSQPKPQQGVHPSSPTNPSPRLSRSITAPNFEKPIQNRNSPPHFEIPGSVLALFTADSSAPPPEDQGANLQNSLSVNVTPRLKTASTTNNEPKPDSGSRRSSICVIERTQSTPQTRTGETPSRKSLHADLAGAQAQDKQTTRQRSLSIGSALSRRLGSTQTIMPPTDLEERDQRRSDISTTCSILTSSEADTQRGNSVHSDVSRGSKDVFTEVDLRGSWDIKQAEINVAKKSKLKMPLRKDVPNKDSKDSSKEKEKEKETKDGKSSKDGSLGKHSNSKGSRDEVKKSQKAKDDRVIDADVPLEEIVQRVTNAFVDQYSHFREEYHAQTETERQRSVSLAATSLQTKYREISANIPPPPPPPPKKTWKQKLMPSCFKPTHRIKSVQLTPEQMGWS